MQVDVLACYRSATESSQQDLRVEQSMKDSLLSPPHTSPTPGFLSVFYADMLSCYLEILISVQVLDGRTRDGTAATESRETEGNARPTETEEIYSAIARQDQEVCQA